ncbi:MAG: NHLP family bacteriocin export ABC transporter peptidase/permease/ATPase subunit [Chlamydiae bacterium CG10_big_fil_rev_8_21_14_0_10_42_34]|nr:MAG: NHLP family bacteriocin export ABC transporter peptidase/permease/ATPase subunit [Chlamydiae bacterium CG10_big_fil_rev_8_21_14_0_10_42_34]
MRFFSRNSSKNKRVKTPTIIQFQAIECGAVSLSIVLGYFGKFVPIEEVRVECGVSRDGSNAWNIIQAAKKYGLDGKGEKRTAEELKEIKVPAILLWKFNHFLVLEGIQGDQVFLNDPSTGPRSLSFEQFQSDYSGVALVFEKTDQFQEGGKPLSLFHHLHERLKEIPGSISYLVLISLCLLLPGFAMPAFLMAFINTFFGQYVLPWKWEFMGAIFLTAILAGSMALTRGFVLNHLNRKLSLSFSSHFLWHLLRLPMNFYTQRYTAEIAYRTSLNTAVAQTLTGPVTTTFIQLLLIIFYAIIMFSYDIAIASIGIISGTINLILMNSLFKSRKNAYAALQQDITRSLTESLGGLKNIETIKAKGIESDFFTKWSGYYTKKMNSLQSLGKKDVILTTVPIVFQFMTLTLLLGIGSIRIIEGSLTIGKLMALQLLMTNFLLPINNFVTLSSLIQNMKLNIERLNDVLKNDADQIYLTRRLKPKETHLDKLSGSLEFRNVSFRYAPLSPPVIQNLSFKIEPGQRLALVGPTGSGKSTVAKLATGLFYPTEGEILYDNVPLKDISIDLFRDSVATVSQDIFLFTGSIRENITLWNAKVPDELLVEAATDASIHEDILMRPKGYDGELAEGGNNLSGGQRQRLEIARALLYNPSIIILDEATSALDTKTEEVVLERIRQRGCSALMIAHRLSTIRDCNEIIVLEKGVTVQRGSHQQLKNEEGLYQTLIESETGS